MRLFTVQQARELLPLLRERVPSLRACLAAIKEAIEQISATRGIDVTDPIIQKLCQEDDSIRLAAEELDLLLGELRNIGVECKSVELGLFDFPCLFQNKVVYLCWRFGENDIGYWHDLDVGFAERKRLLDDIEATPTADFIH